MGNEGNGRVETGETADQSRGKGRSEHPYRRAVGIGLCSLLVMAIVAGCAYSLLRQAAQAPSPPRGDRPSLQLALPPAGLQEGSRSPGSEADQPAGTILYYESTTQRI